MNWYILLAHPNPGSFNHAVCNALVEGLDQAGASYEVNDLYATGFNPMMAGDDFNQFEDGGILPADVLAEQAKVERADCLALIYPVWWNEAPAILKGWFDRILSKGWAYDITADGEFRVPAKIEKGRNFEYRRQPHRTPGRNRIKRRRPLNQSRWNVHFLRGRRN